MYLDDLDKVAELKKQRDLVLKAKKLMRGAVLVIDPGSEERDIEIDLPDEMGALVLDQLIGRVESQLVSLGVQLPPQEAPDGAQ